jgi:hypothetical protein
MLICTTNNEWLKTFKYNLYFIIPIKALGIAIRQRVFDLVDELERLEIKNEKLKHLCGTYTRGQKFPGKRC